MYFIEQIKRKLLNLCVSNIAEGIKSDAPDVKETEKQASDKKKDEGFQDIDMKHMSPEQKKKVEEVRDKMQELRGDLDVLKAGEKITKASFESLRVSLTEGISEEEQKDPEIQYIVSIFNSYRERLGAIMALKHNTQEELSKLKEEIAELKDDMSFNIGGEFVAKEIENAEENKTDTYIREKAKELGIDAEIALQMMGDKFGGAEDMDEEENELFSSPEAIDKYFEEHMEELKGIKLEDLKGEPSKETVEKITTAMIASNPSTWMDRTTGIAEKKFPDFLVKINQFLKDIFGVDLLKHFKGNHREAMGNLIGGNGQVSLGSLSEHFESGGKGPLAIKGNDKGKPSFGTYQLRADSLAQFAKQNGIEGNHEELGEDSEFAENWKAKVEEIGQESFQKLEHKFIKKTHFDPQMTKIAGVTGVDVKKFSLTTQNVIWSISVQHGPGSNVFIDAVEELGVGTVKPGDIESEKKLIETVYSIRTSEYSEEGSRYASEQKIALAQLSIFTSKEYNGSFVSASYEKSAKGTTLCSKTARLNAAQAGLTVPQGSSAKASFESYDSSRIQGFPPTDSSAKYADVFLDASAKNREYGHRAFAIKQDGAWFVLDPYYAMPGMGRTRQPIPAETYLARMEGTKGRRFWGAAYY